jgi:large subunit ribosomal protein L10
VPASKDLERLYGFLWLFEDAVINCDLCRIYVRVNQLKMEKTLSLNLQEKQAVVAEVSAQVAQAQTIVLAEYRGIGVADITKLRANARNAGVYFHVLKNTLARRAVQGTPFEALADKMVGPLVYSISVDAVAAAKVVHDFAKTNDKLVIKAGSMAGSVMSADEVKVLAATPSRDELIARLMATMNATTAKFVRTLAAVREQKEAVAA